MDEPLELYIEAFAGLIERYDRRMADVAEEIKAIEGELAKLSQSVRRSAARARSAATADETTDTGLR